MNSRGHRETRSSRPVWLTGRHVAVATGTLIGAAIGASQTDGPLGLFAVVGDTIGSIAGSPGREGR